MVQGCGNDTDFSWSNYSSEHDMKDGCYRYNLTVTDPILHCDPHNISSIEPALLDKCDQWMYDTSTFESTIFTEVIPALEIHTDSQLIMFNILNPVQFTMR